MNDHPPSPPPSHVGPRPSAVLTWVGTVAVALVVAALLQLPRVWAASVDARAHEVARMLCPPPAPPSPAVLEAEAAAMAARETVAELNARLSLIADALQAPPTDGAR